MPLTLKITSKQRHILGADSLRVFSVHGGSIGRASDNDWVLPDPDRYISGHHATVDYRDGAYYLRDTSTNGVFVNRSDQPVGRGAPLRLYDGDELRMGDYVFQVMVVNVSKDGADDSGDGARAPRIRRKQEDVSALSLKLLGDEADEMQAANAEGELPPPKPPRTPQDRAATVRLADSLGGDTRTHLGEKEAGEFKLDAAPPASRPGSDEPPKAAFGGARRDFIEAVRLLMESAGLDSTHLPRDQEEEVVILMGKLMRGSVDGLQTLLRSRALAKSQFRLEQTSMQPAGNNPLKMMPGSQEVLEQMFYRGSEGYMEPLEALQEAFADLRAHQTALVKALFVAFRDLLNRFDPDALEERFQQGQPAAKRGGLLSGSPKTRYWELYPEAYRSIAGFSDDNFATVLKAKFNEAYEREIQHLAATEARRKR